MSKPATGIFLLLLTGWLLGTAYATDAHAQPRVDGVEKLFEEGLAERETGDIEEAIKAFQTILSNQPLLHRARLELAVAYLQALNFNEARKNAEQVLNDPATPEGVKVKIRLFLERIKVESTAHLWSPYVFVGKLWDSNVRAANNEVILGGITPTGLPNILKQSDHAATLNAGISHRYLSPDTLRIGGRSTAFLWQSQANFYQLDYSSANDFDLGVMSLSTGPAWVAARAWRANINVQADNVRLGHRAYANFYGVNPVLTGIFSVGHTEITGDVLWQKRVYRRPAEDGRDSRYASIGLNAGHVLEGDTVSMQGGVRYFKENTEELTDVLTGERTGFSSHGDELFMGANWQATNRFNIYGRVSHRNTRFETDSFSFAPIVAERKDTEKRYTIGANYKFRDSWLDKWTLSGNFTYIENDSNIMATAYNRNQASITFGRTF